MPDTISRLNEALAGRYRVERELGRGGMANVYLADDLKHDRQVALKVLKPELAAAVGADRFLAEIKTIAGMQHPHILPLHDSGEADGLLFYVMPYVDGESLRSRMDREGQLPVDDAIEIAKRVGEALDHAHRHGIVHRDVKPANILLSEGQPLVSDFGIAVAVGGADQRRLTETGVAIGSPDYMSPEQAAADERIGPTSDVFSLGSVLYEMLVGDPPFRGVSTQATILKILSDEVGPVTARRKSVPPHVSSAVSHALQKLPADRFKSARDFVRALDDPTFTEPAASAVPVASPSRRWVFATTLAVAAVPLAFIAGQTGGGDDDDPVLRLGLDLPEGQRLVGGTGSRLDVTSDGLAFVYVGEGIGGAGGSHLWFRDLRRQRATPIEGTEGAVAPALSPDGQYVAFRRGDAIWVVGRGGDTPIMAADDLGSGATSLDWAADGFIYFGGRGVFRVPSGGGPTEQVVPQDDDRRLLFGPRVLPGGRAVIFALGQNETRSENVIAVADLETGTAQVLTSGVAAVYSNTGHVLVVRADGRIDAIPFDEGELQVSGPVETVGTGIGVGNWGAVDLALSESGTLLYTTGVQEPRRQVVFVDEAGFAKPVDEGWTGPWESVLLSPEEDRLLVGTGFGASPQLWVRDLARGQMTRLTMVGDLNRRPVWSDDGSEVTFISDRDGYRAVYRKRADGVGPAELVLALPDEHVDEADWSPGEEWLVYRTGMTGGDGRDLYAWHVGGDSARIPIAANPAYDELSPILSPDGRWLAYTSYASGTEHVYVRSFPNPDAFRMQISVDAAGPPRWSDDGRKLFFEEISATGRRLMAVDVTTGPTFSVVGSRPLFDTSPYFITQVGFDHHSGDGTFVMIRRDPSGSQGDLMLIRNFVSELSLSAEN